MNSKDIFGVALTKCFFCQGSGGIVMNTRLSEPMAAKVNDMNGKVLNMEPCDKCKEFMKQGVILITIDDSKSKPGWTRERMPNPYRTGGWFVVKDALIEKACNNEAMKQWALKHRWMFIEEEAARMMGLYEAANEASKEEEGK